MQAALLSQQPSARRSAIAQPATPSITSIVFVVDDDHSVRQSLKLSIGAAGWNSEAYASATELLARPRTGIPCCLVLDVTLPGLNDPGLQRQLAERRDMPIVFLTGPCDVPPIVQAIKVGPVEFLTQPFSNDALLAAIGGALERSRAALRQESQLRQLRNCLASLTPRERQVMELVASGLLNKQVGGELGISEITVKAHRGQVMRKMHADSLPHLVMMAAHLGSIPTSNGLGAGDLLQWTPSFNDREH